ncbi:hypothetical protein E2562_004582 [Oryza meyeriana var. granulata]|uniref:Uncharacterized protein n=1 Tax=Oryza meyeriana var. granulata TaxID=110450 RepID=A0A6G1F3H0_9ORYZ|nr:hypothetical protein E2562_004582 [Oryza meyeriana var. granulata]
MVWGYRTLSTAKKRDAYDLHRHPSSAASLTQPHPLRGARLLGKASPLGSPPPHTVHSATPTPVAISVTVATHSPVSYPLRKWQIHSPPCTTFSRRSRSPGKASPLGPLPLGGTWISSASDGARAVEAETEGNDVDVADNRENVAAAVQC